MSKFVSIEVDQKSLNTVTQALRTYGRDAAKALLRGLWRTGLSIESDAKRRLNGQLGSARHWITGRLASSVHTEAKGQNSFKGESASEASDSSFGIQPDELEVYVGTNVAYAPKIEFEYDSFIEFATLKRSPELTKNIEKELDKLAKKFNK